MVNGEYGVVISISEESTRITIKFRDGTEKMTYIEDIEPFGDMSGGGGASGALI